MSKLTVTNQNPIDKEFDVLVVGGGPAGVRVRWGAGGPELPQQPAATGGDRLHSPARGAIDPEHRRGQRRHAHHRPAAADDQLWRQLTAGQPAHRRPAAALLPGGGGSGAGAAPAPAPADAEAAERPDRLNPLRG